MTAVVEKAFGAKDYSKLIPVQEVDSLGRHVTVWKLPEDVKQRPLIAGDAAGKDNPVGKRGYVDDLDQKTQKHMVDPLVKIMKEVNPDLAGRMTYKYQNYHFDRDTRELDIKHDYEMAWYMRKIKGDPEHKADWQKEYNQKTDNLIKQINGRKAAMMKVKPGRQVKYYGKPAIVSSFSRRGFPVVRTEKGDRTALWEEIA